MSKFFGLINKKILKKGNNQDKEEIHVYSNKKRTSIFDQENQLNFNHQYYPESN